MIRLSVLRSMGAFQGGLSTTQIPTLLETRVPKELKKLQTYDSHVLGELWQSYSQHVANSAGDPGKILRHVAEYMKAEDEIDVRFIIQTLGELGSTFDFNSFWSSSDKEMLTSNKIFKWMISDLIDKRVDPRDVPVIVFALACLEYRPVRLVDQLVNLAEQHRKEWTLPILANMAFSFAMLNVPNSLVSEAMRRFGKNPGAGTLHDWSQLAFAATIEGGSEGELFLKNASHQIRTKAQLDRSGWAQFFLYQAIYSMDVLSGEANPLPPWVQEHLHHRWLSGSLLATCQPQGANSLQLDVDQALKRTSTNAVLNCSAGRDTDEQHCWFVGHKLVTPGKKIAIEYNTHLPDSNGMNLPSGWIKLKTRVLQKCGYSIAVIHKSDWSKFDEKQKDHQILLLRNQLGYMDAEVQTEAKTSNGGRILQPGVVRWEDQPDWVPHMREPELHFTVHGYKPKDNPDFKGGIQVNKRRKYIANGNHNWVNSLSPKG